MITLSNEFVERYRNLLVGVVELDNDATTEEIHILNSLSLEDTAHLTTSLIKDLGYLISTRPTPTRFSKYLFARLLNTLYNSTKISDEDWRHLVNNCSFTLFTGMINNPSFPIELLVSNNPFEENFASPLFSYSKPNFEKVFLERLPEVTLHARSIVPNSESMSDEMVLKVSGIGF